MNCELRMKKCGEKGLTLIEVILYVAIVSIVLMTLIPFAWNVIEGGAKSATEQEVFDNARYISEQIKYQIRNATGINSVAATSISLATSNPATNPTIIDLSGGNIRVTQSGVGWYNANYLFRKQITIDHTKVGLPSHDADSQAQISSGTTITWNHTTGTYNNRLLIVGVTTGATANTVSSVTYNSKSLSPVPSSSVNCQNGTVCLTQLWYMVAPDTGINQVKVTLSGSGHAAAGAATFYDVDQINPLGTAATNSNVSPNSSPTITVSSNARQLVADVLVDTGNSTSVTPGTNQTKIWEDEVNEGSAGSWKRGSASNTTMSWTLNNTDNWALAAVPINPADVTNFPVLISVTDPNLKTVGNGGSVQNASGFDIIFSDSNNSIKLDHEIEKYVPTTGEIEMWVRIPTLSASSDTIINMYYDNSTISTTQENKTGVWDTNYKAVWHLSDNAANTTVAESTVDAYTGTSIANTSTKTGTGQIASALTFNGTTDMVKRANSSGLNSLGGVVTASAWEKVTSVTNEPTVFSTWDGTHGYQIYIKSTGAVALFSDGGSDLISATTVNNGAWHYIVGQWDGTTAHIYVDGTQVLTGARTFANSTLDDQIGTQCTGASSTTCSSFFTGQIDEVRVSSNVRTAGWIATEYANQNLPGTFSSFGSATAQSGGSAINLNSQNATVSALTFTNYTSGDNKTKNIQFSFTIGAIYPGAGSRQEFNESTTMEGDAELRSN